MPLTNAEKQRRYRAKRDADPERRDEYLQKEEDKYKRDKELGKKKLVHQMTSREHRVAKKQWKLRKQATKRKHKAQQPSLTPPESPECIRPQIPESRQKQQARKMKDRSNSKSQRKIRLLEKQLSQEKKKVDMFRKRAVRLLNRSKQGADTPRTKTKKLLRNFSKTTVRKTLLFHTVLMDTIKHKYKFGGQKSKRAIHDILRGNILRKYKLTTHAKKVVECPTNYGHYVKEGSLTHRLAKSVRTFFLRDDVSRVTTGLKNTITRHKEKHQKRLLNDSMINLHKKYSSETKEKIGYTSFTRLRPFWVTSPTELDRKTCLCKTCENVKYLSKKLNGLNILQTCGLESLVKYVACDTNSKTCMYGQCPNCKEKRIIEHVSNVNDTVSWLQWRTVKETKMLKGSPKDVTMTVKTTETGMIGDLVDLFHEQIWRYRRHSFNITNQFNHYKTVRHNLTDSECLVHVDFSENYVGKMSDEIQGTHFGASKIQITLHTGAYFIGAENKVKCTTFSTISDSLQHGPAAIWAHLHPVLTEIREKYPDVQYVHFFSDGPCTQYRQKGNFYRFSKNVFDMGFKGSAWNFHEAGHGKGIPDGVGGTLKRMADLKVRHGRDIMSADSFMKALEANTSIELFLVSEAEINADRIKDTSLKAVPGTMRLHQICTYAPGQLFYRDVSCTCSAKKTCENHECLEFKYVVPMTNKRKNQQPETDTKRLKMSSSTACQKDVSPGDFATILTMLQACADFEMLQKECRKIKLNEIEGQPRSILGDTHTVDQAALDMYPDDVPAYDTIYPTRVKADGDCLPSSGSVFAFGHQDRSNEIRTRIVIELALHENLYLSQDHLHQGIDIPTNRNIAKQFAMYSNMYIPGVGLQNEVIKAIYEQEVMAIRKPKTNMGMWQLFALSSVLKIPIFSVYPKRGNPNTRMDLHRLIQPRVTKSACNLHIMWCTTGSYTAQEHWVPNHFVPLLPTEVSIHEKGKDSVHDEYLGDTSAGKAGIDGDAHIGATDGANVESKNPDDLKKCEKDDVDDRKEETGDNNDTSKEKKGNDDDDKGNVERDGDNSSTEKKGDVGEATKDDTGVGEDLSKEKKEAVDVDAGKEDKGDGADVNIKNKEDDAAGKDHKINDDEASKEKRDGGDSCKDETVDIEDANKKMNGDADDDDADIYQKRNHDVVRKEKNEDVVNASTYKNRDAENDAGRDKNGDGDDASKGKEEDFDDDARKDGKTDFDAGSDKKKEDAVDKVEKGDGEDTSKVKKGDAGKYEKGNDEDARKGKQEDVDDDAGKDEKKDGEDSRKENKDEADDDAGKDENGGGDDGDTGEYAIEDVDDAMTEDKGDGGESSKEKKDADDDVGKDENRGGDGACKEKKEDAGGDAGKCEEGDGEYAKKENKGDDDDDAVKDEKRYYDASKGKKCVDDDAWKDEKEDSDGESKEKKDDVDDAIKDVKGGGQDSSKERMREVDDNVGKHAKGDGDDNSIKEKHFHFGLMSKLRNYAISHVDDLLGQYVVVAYDGSPYPGYVEDIGDSDIFCECMNVVGRQNNCFFWPKTIKDKCWYDFEKILAVIPKPQLVQGTDSHFYVEPALWKAILSELKS